MSLCHSIVPWKVEVLSPVVILAFTSIFEEELSKHHFLPVFSACSESSSNTTLLSPFIIQAIKSIVLILCFSPAKIFEIHQLGFAKGHFSLVMLLIALDAIKSTLRIDSLQIIFYFFPSS
jgi:hypothetical protein